MSKPTDIDSIFADLVPPSSSSPAPAPAVSNSKPSTPLATSEAELFKDLENLTATSRPVTPRLTRGPRKSTEVRTGVSRRSEEVSRSEETSTTTPVAERPGLGTHLEEEGRGQESVPQQQQQQQQQGGGGGGGWWGGLWNTASAAVQTAKDVTHQLQTSEEGKKWVEQVRGLSSNVGTLRELSSTVTSRALPTVTNILHTLAPPISEHEQLRIHLTHDLVGYPSLDTIVYGVFDRVMQQVEGGSLLVVQRGSEGKPRTSLPTFAMGPWWRAAERRDVGTCEGAREGLKLARAGVEEYARVVLAGREGERTDPNNPVRKSDIFLGIQACTFPASTIAAPLLSSTDGGEKDSDDDEEDNTTLLAFAIHLYDPTHSLSFSTLSQSLPAPWLTETLDAPPSSSGDPYPDIIREQIARGGMDPREWVVEWMEESVGLAVGVLAQRYVARRMGVDGKEGEGEEVVGGGAKVAEVGRGAGEEARAGAL